MNSMVSPAYCLEHFRATVGRENPDRTWRSFWVEETSERMKDGQGQGNYDSHRRVTKRRDLHKKGALEICKHFSGVLSWPLISAHKWGNHPRQGKEQTRNNFMFSLARVERLCTTWGIEYSTQKGIVSIVGKISFRLKVVLVCLTNLKKQVLGVSNCFQVISLHLRLEKAQECLGEYKISSNLQGKIHDVWYSVKNYHVCKKEENRTHNKNKK